MKKENFGNQIDFVVTWVDDRDPAWCAKRNKALGLRQEEGNSDVRYRDWETLKYWFRAVEKFAPWVRYIHFVTDNQKPEWLNIEHPQIKWVKHTDFIPTEYLPTFNSVTINWFLHRIPDLAEQFVYLNDDVFLIKETKPEDFFVKGLPCDRLQLGWIFPGDFFEFLVFNNAALINRNFVFKEQFKKHWKKWLSNQTLKHLLKILFFCKKRGLPGTQNNHIHGAYLKSTYEAIWEKEAKCLHESCVTKVRTCNDVTDWCVRDWQLLSGEYTPRKPIGKGFSTSELEHSKEPVEYIRKQKGKVVCLNDNEREVNFEKHKQMIIDAFEELLPEKSAFEL